MDLNELLHAHQVEVMKASGSGDDAGQKSHFAKVALYADKIRKLRDSRLGAEPLPLTNSAQAIIYGTYAGDPSSGQENGPFNNGESHGNALHLDEEPLPPGITSKTLNQYYVGSYLYTDLSLALAEHARQNQDGDAQ